MSQQTEILPESTYRTRDEIQKTITVWKCFVRCKNNLLHCCRKERLQNPAMETDVDHIHVLLEYDTTERICDIVKELKQKSTYYLWEQFVNVLKSEYWKKKIFWSDGYFACSIGEVSESTIHHYFYESFPDFFQQEKNAYSYTYTLLLEIVQEMVFSLRNHTMHEYPAFQLDKN